MSERKPKLTQREIARAVGVSQPVVSAVLSGSTSIRCSKAKRLEILNLAKGKNYRPNHQAQILRHGRSGLIGLVQQSAFSEIAECRAAALSRAVNHRGMRVLAVSSSWFSHRSDDLVDLMLDAAVEGVIFSSTSEWVTEELVERFREAGVPVVLVGSYSHFAVAEVQADTEENFYQLTRHVLGTGRRSLVLGLYGDEAMYPVDMPMAWSTEGRLKGFIRALSEVGALVDGPDYLLKRVGYEPATSLKQRAKIHGTVVVSGRIAEERDYPQAGQRIWAAVRQLVPAVDGLLCSNDELALGALKAAYDCGVEVGRDLSLTGYDNINAGAYALVPITSMRQPSEEMAARGVDILCSMIEGKRSLHYDKRVVCGGAELMVRSTCGAHRINSVTNQGRV